MFTTSRLSYLLTDEEFNSFHTIDRELYSILIFELGRDMAESMKVMAFLLWLERLSTGGQTVVKRMLSFSYDEIKKIADESVMCLKCAEKDQFSNPESEYKLDLLPRLLGRNVPLKFFYDHRVLLREGVATTSQVCDRAFKDINQNALNSLAWRFSGQTGNVSFGGLHQQGPSVVSQAFSFGGVHDQEGSSMVGRKGPDCGEVDQQGPSSMVSTAFSFGGVYDQEAGSSMAGRRMSDQGKDFSFGGVDQASSSRVDRTFSFGGVDESAGSSPVPSRALSLGRVDQVDSSMVGRPFFPSRVLSLGRIDVADSSMDGRRVPDHGKDFTFGGVDQQGPSLVSQAFSSGGVYDQEAGSSMAGRRMSDHSKDFSFGGVDQASSSRVDWTFSFGGVDEPAGSSRVPSRALSLGRVDQVDSSMVGRSFFPSRALSLGRIDEADSSMVGQPFFPSRTLSLGRVDEAGSSMVGRPFFPSRSLSYGRVDEADSSMVGQTFFPRIALSYGRVDEADSSMVSQPFSFHAVNQSGPTTVTRAIPFGGIDQAGSPMVSSARTLQGLPPSHDEIIEILNNLNLDEEYEIAPEDRTIFLTFSRGYPVSETEVRDFFTGVFGDFIEDIHMQNVLPGEQVLYARMVARAGMVSVIDAVVGGGKTKYNINGKHVCARKFEKRAPPHPSAASTYAQSRSRRPPLAPRR